MPTRNLVARWPDRCCPTPPRCGNSTTTSSTRPGGGVGVDLAEDVAQTADDDWEEETFRRDLSATLAEGGFRLVLAVDQITQELRGIVEDLNLHSSAGMEFVALELSYVVDGDTEILVPREYGLESAAVRKPPSTANHRTLDQARAEIATVCLDDEVALLDELIDICTGEDQRVAQPGRGKDPAISGYLELHGELRAVWAVRRAQPAHAEDQPKLDAQVSVGCRGSSRCGATRRRTLVGAALRGRVRQ